MCTVPAHSFCAPVRAKVIAAWRSMPGVCAVLASSLSAGTTRTPSCFQGGSPGGWACRSVTKAPAAGRVLFSIQELRIGQEGGHAIDLVMVVLGVVHRVVGLAQELRGVGRRLVEADADA